MDRAADGGGSSTSLGSRCPATRHDYGKQRPMSVLEAARKAKGWEGRSLAARHEGMAGVAFRGDAGTAIEWIRPRGTATQKKVWLLVEWPESEKEPIKYFFCDLPETYTLRRLVRLAKCRWKIEQDYQQLKEELGLDHYEGRSWIGWHHHTTLVIMAHAFLTLETLRRKKTSGWTLPQTRREIQYLLITWTGVCA
jgi:hypothetical protein